MSKNNIQLPSDYIAWISSLKPRIAGARQRALLSANEEQIRLYHDIGDIRSARVPKAGEPRLLITFHLISEQAFQT